MLEEVTQEFVDAKNYPFRRQSAVDKSLYFHEHQWVVSVLNTKEKEFGGHAVILVEGIKDSQLFIGRYDVFAVTGDQDLSGQSSFFSVINKKGYIANVRAEESSSYDRIACHLVLISNTIKEIPTDISKNEIILQKVQEEITAYWLDGSRIRQEPLSIEKIAQQENLKFPAIEERENTIRPTENEELIKEVTALCGYEHPDGATFYGQCQSRSFKRPPEDIEKMIQSIQEDKAKTERARTGEDNYIRYQYLGSEKACGLLKLFSQSGCGINCAEWCLDKLKVAGIKLEVKPTPTRIAGGPCLIL